VTISGSAKFLHLNADMSLKSVHLPCRPATHEKEIQEKIHYSSSQFMMLSLVTKSTIVEPKCLHLRENICKVKIKNLQ